MTPAAYTGADAPEETDDLTALITDAGLTEEQLASLFEDQNPAISGNESDEEEEDCDNSLVSTNEPTSFSTQRKAMPIKDYVSSINDIGKHPARTRITPTPQPAIEYIDSIPDCPYFQWETVVWMEAANKIGYILPGAYSIQTKWLSPIDKYMIRVQDVKTKHLVFGPYELEPEVDFSNWNTDNVPEPTDRHVWTQLRRELGL